MNRGAMEIFCHRDRLITVTFGAEKGLRDAIGDLIHLRHNLGEKYGKAESLDFL